MMIFQELRVRQCELLEQLDELDEAVIELTARLESAADDDDEEDVIERSERLAWLHRQQAGARAMLGETERALLALGD